MKQIINKHYDGSILNKYYENHLKQKNGILIHYRYYGNLYCKTNYINDKEFGLENWYINNKPTKIIYYL